MKEDNVSSVLKSKTKVDRNNNINNKKKRWRICNIQNIQTTFIETYTQIQNHHKITRIG